MLFNTLGHLVWVVLDRLDHWEGTHAHFISTLQQLLDLQLTFKVQAAVLVLAMLVTVGRRLLLLVPM